MKIKCLEKLRKNVAQFPTAVTITQTPGLKCYCGDLILPKHFLRFFQKGLFFVNQYFSFIRTDNQVSNTLLDT